MRKTNNMNGTMTMKRVRPTHGKLAPIPVNNNIFEDQNVMESRESSLRMSRKGGRMQKYGRLKPMNS